MIPRESSLKGEEERQVSRRRGFLSESEPFGRRMNLEIYCLLYSFSALFQANYWETPSVRSERVLTDGKFPVREDSLEKRRLKDGAELRNLPRRG